MTRSPVKCLLVASGGGVFLCFALLGILLAVRQWNESLQTGGLHLLAPASMIFLYLGIACGVAFHTRPHGRAVFITTSIPAVAAYLIGYTMDMETQFKASARHAMTGGALGDVPPLKLIGQAVKAFSFVLCAAVSGVIARALTPARVGRETGADQNFGLAFVFFVGGAVTLLVAGLIAYAIIFVGQNTSEARPASARKVLSSSASSQSERSAAIFDVWRLKIGGVNELLREAAQNQPHPLNLQAATILAGRNEIFALPILEAHLLKSGTVVADHFRLNAGFFSVRSVTLRPSQPWHVL